ncbi:hypothetical protein [Collimonas fungivorans]|nr:hypothetical protein [Collimonas fungivorans]
MEITSTHHIDKSELDENGMYDYYYEYDIYEFSENGLSYIARSYSDAPLDAHILKKKNDKRWRIFGKAKYKILGQADFKNALFIKAVAHLRTQGKERISVLSKTGYEPV